LDSTIAQSVVDDAKTDRVKRERGSDDRERDLFREMDDGSSDLRHAILVETVVL
jgi:hypothetical protein